MSESEKSPAVTSHRALPHSPVPDTPTTPGPTQSITWGSALTLHASPRSNKTRRGSDCAFKRPSSSTSKLLRSQTLPDSKHNRKAVQHTWALEYGALLLSICTTITLALLLFFADGKPVARFSAFSLSFNTIISILGALIHTELAFAIGSCLAQEKWNWYKTRPDSLAGFERFEQASRGPWGSLWLVVWINVRHWAVLGALSTIALLAFEPFLQAVVSFGGKLDAAGLATRPAHLGWVSRLNAGSYTSVGGATAAVMLPSGGTVMLSSYQGQPDLSMVAALYAGFDSGKVNGGVTPLYSCPSGNCTWAPFTTLGVCSVCNDVTDLLVGPTKVNGSNLGTINNPSSMMVRGIFESYSLPYVNLSNHVSDAKFGLEAYMAARAISNPGLTLSFQDIDTMISAVGIIKADPSYAAGTTAWNETKVTASECALYYCAKALEAKVTHSDLDEQVIGTWADRVPDSFQPANDWGGNRTDFAAYEAYNNYTLIYLSSMSATRSLDVQRDDLQVRIPSDAAVNVPASIANESTVFNISAATIGSMTNYINDEFFSSAYQSALVWPRAGKQGFSQAPCAQTLYETKDLNTTFASAATALSNWMRSYGNSTKKGRQEEWVQHIEVQWWYTTAPLVTYVCGCAFVVLAIAETRRLKLEPWKDDVIALMAHSLTDEMKWKFREAELEGKTWKVANRTLVKFEDTGAGLELKGH